MSEFVIFKGSINHYVENLHCGLGGKHGGNTNVPFTRSQITTIITQHTYMWILLTVDYVSTWTKRVRLSLVTLQIQNWNIKKCFKVFYHNITSCILERRLPIRARLPYTAVELCVSYSHLMIVCSLKRLHFFLKMTIKLWWDQCLKICLWYQYHENKHGHFKGE